MYPKVPPIHHLVSAPYPSYILHISPYFSHLICSSPCLSQPLTRPLSPSPSLSPSPLSPPRDPLPATLINKFPLEAVADQANTHLGPLGITIGNSIPPRFRHLDFLNFGISRMGRILWYFQDFPDFQDFVVFIFECLMFGDVAHRKCTNLCLGSRSFYN